MSTIVTRAGKGSPLTHTEVDANFTNLNNDKAGYVTGEGGAVTQATSKSTAVTLNKKCGTVTMNGAALSGTLSGTPTFSGVGTHSALDIFNAGISVKNGSTSAGFIELYEDSDNGTNKVTLIGNQ